MKRILMVLTVAALLVVAMSVAAVSAFANPCSNSPSNPNCVTANPGGQPHGASQTTTFQPGHGHK